MTKIETFKYVKWPDLAEAIRAGWIPTSALEGTHHGVWSVLCKKDEQPEEWRDIPGYEGSYQVSSYGAVRSLNRTISVPGAVRGYPRSIKGRPIKPAALPDGYLFVSLTREVGEKSPRYIAHLVAEAFIGHRPDSVQVAHNDGIRVNNRADNLRYATRLENEADKEIHGTVLRGEQCPASRLTESQVREIRRRACFEPMKNIAADFSIQITHVSAIANMKSWASLPLLPGECGTAEGNEIKRENFKARRAAWAAKLAKSRAGRIGR